MPTLDTFDYAWIHVMPRVQTGEFLRVGVILFCRTQRFLGARLAYDRAQLALFASNLAIDALEAHLALLPAICAGAGPIGRLEQAEVFHWLVAPHSTVIQTSPVHTGLCQDPASALDRLTATLLP